ncbi:hypothetical protein [Paenibacillus xylaniclasticus]|uniref:hypothetical protein n=1 Tax=Paenibacillus xylaniclasticus TaxID=588083 RepID=UPI0017644932|nr:MULTISPECIES: hypothetical protein [Paenibacillus]GFN32543.1 hypothetical protein PCURB6_28030 [Paenibacillus curdlanolyticus]
MDSIIGSEKIKMWIKENLVMQDEARIITKQSRSAFNQAVATGHIKHFIEFGSERKTRLYLREELEAYAEKKRPQRGN